MKFYGFFCAWLLKCDMIFFWVVTKVDLIFYLFWDAFYASHIDLGWTGNEREKRGVGSGHDTIQLSQVYCGARISGANRCTNEMIIVTAILLLNKWFNNQDHWQNNVSYSEQWQENKICDR